MPHHSTKRNAAALSEIVDFLDGKPEGFVRLVLEITRRLAQEKVESRDP